MTGVARATLDIAGGVILSGSPTVFVNDLPAAYCGSPVQPHPPFGPLHGSPSMAQGSPTVYVDIGGGQTRRISRQGDAATCGHIATGSSNVFAGGAPVSC